MPSPSPMLVQAKMRLLRRLRSATSRGNGPATGGAARRSRNACMPNAEETMARQTQAQAGALDSSSPPAVHSAPKAPITSAPRARARTRRHSAASAAPWLFNVLGMAVEVMQDSSRDVDARQSPRRPGAGLPRCDEWRAQATNRLYACVNAIPYVHRRARCYVVENRHRNGVAGKASTFEPRGVSWRA